MGGFPSCNIFGVKPVGKHCDAFLFCCLRCQLCCKAYVSWVGNVRCIRWGWDWPAYFQQVLQLPSITDFHTVVKDGGPYRGDERDACCESCGQAAAGVAFHTFSGCKAEPVMCVLC